MKKNVIGSVAVLLAAVLATGCGNAIPELNEEQQKLVVEYAASELLKYDANHQSRLVELTLEQEAAEKSEENNISSEEEKTDNIEEAETGADDVTVIDNTRPVNEYASIEEFLQLDTVKFTYTGYETDSFYPDQGEELYFVMNATEGNKLLVLKFNMENISGSEAALDIAQSGIRFKIVVNGQEKNALTTMLLNDLAYYRGMLAPGESTEVVLVCEIPETEAGTITSLELKMKNVDDIATISLN